MQQRQFVIDVPYYLCPFSLVDSSSPRLHGDQIEPNISGTEQQIPDYP
jgi:hypothetical protein